MDYRCVHCSSPLSQLWRGQDHSLRLTVCNNCNQVADPMLELDGILIYLRLLCFEQLSLRHLCYNLHARQRFNRLSIDKALRRAKLLLICCEAYLYCQYIRTPDSGLLFHNRRLVASRWFIHLDDTVATPEFAVFFIPLALTLTTTYLRSQLTFNMLGGPTLSRSSPAAWIPLLWEPLLSLTELHQAYRSSSVAVVSSFELSKLISLVYTLWACTNLHATSGLVVSTLVLLGMELSSVWLSL
eukprot:m.122853 g.122853  ORF g.122853 m.122853 type:complete len:242 (+) comp15661_c0_seq2:2622-3347(+)